MSLSKTPTGEVLYKSALFGASLSGVFLWSKEVLPKYIGIISISAASFGLCSYVWYILKGDKRSSNDFCPENTYYDEIASQVNKELSQEGSQCDVRRTVGENETFDPIAYLRSGTKISEVLNEKEPSCHGDLLKTRVSVSGSKMDKIIPKGPSELPLSEGEDEPTISEIKVKKKQGIFNLRKTKLGLLRDAIVESNGQSSQSIAELLKEWEPLYPEAEKEIKGTKKEKSRKIFGVRKYKAQKK